MTPMASQHRGKNGHRRIRDASLKAARYCAMAILPIFITFIVRGHSFISLWMGPSYADLSYHVLWILSIPWVFGAGAAVLSSTILGIGKHKPVVPVAIAEGLCNLILSIILVKKMGIVGVAWGTAIPNMIVDIVYWPWYSRARLWHSHPRIRSLDLVLSCGFPAPVRRLHIRRRQALASSESNDFFLQVAAVLPSALVGAWYSAWYGKSAKPTYPI